MFFLRKKRGFLIPFQTSNLFSLLSSWTICTSVSLVILSCVSFKGLISGLILQGCQVLNSLAAVLNSAHGCFLVVKILTYNPLRSPSQTDGQPQQLVL